MRVELEEDVAEAQLTRLCEQLEGILPEINVSPQQEPAQNVATLSNVQSGWVTGPDHHEDDGHGTARLDPVVAMITRRAAE